jgi:hypothetical protein
MRFNSGFKGLISCVSIKLGYVVIKMLLFGIFAPSVCPQVSSFRDNSVFFCWVINHCFTLSYATDVYVRWNLVIVDSALVFRYNDTSDPCVKASGDPESSPSPLVRPVLNLSTHSLISSTSCSYR